MDLDARRQAIKDEQRRRRAVGRRAVATAKRTGLGIVEAKRDAAKEERKHQRKRHAELPETSKAVNKKQKLSVDAHKDDADLDAELARLESELAEVEAFEDSDDDEADVDAAEAKRMRKETKRRARAAVVENEGTTASAESEVDVAEAKRRRKEEKRRARAAAAEEAEHAAVLREADVDVSEAKRRRKEERRRARAAAAAEQDAAALVEDDVDAAGAKRRRKEEKRRSSVVAADEDNAAVMAEAGGKSRAEVDSPYRLFVGGVAWHIVEATLQRDFEECGEVVDCKLLMGADGRSRGIAFVTMADKVGFDAAIRYDGEMYAGRKLSVSPRIDSHGKGRQPIKNPDGKGTGKGKSKGIGHRPDGCKSVVVKGLSYEVTSEDLYECFASCGSTGPANVKLLTEDDTGKSRGVAFVDFSTEGAVGDAVKLSETVLRGRAFYIRYSDKH